MSDALRLSAVAALVAGNAFFVIGGCAIVSGNRDLVDAGLADGVPGGLPQLPRGPNRHERR